MNNIKITGVTLDKKLKTLQKIYNRIYRENNCFENNIDFLNEIIKKDRKAIFSYLTIAANIVTDAGTLESLKSAIKRMRNCFECVQESVCYSFFNKKDYMIDNGICTAKRLQDNISFYEEAGRLGLSNQHALKLLPKYSKTSIILKGDISAWLEFLKIAIPVQRKNSKLELLAADILKCFNNSIPVIFNNKGGKMIAEFTKKIMIRITEEQYEKLKKEKNFSEIIRELIDEYLERAK